MRDYERLRMILRENKIKIEANPGREKLRLTEIERD